MATELLFAFATRHKFNNGNKRTALVTVVNFLQFCGIFLFSTNVTIINYMKNWEIFMVKIVDYYSIKKISEKEILEDIIKVIDNSVSISYNRYT